MPKAKPWSLKKLATLAAASGSVLTGAQTIPTVQEKEYAGRRDLAINPNTVRETIRAFSSPGQLQGEIKSTREQLDAHMKTHWDLLEKKEDLTNRFTRSPIKNVGLFTNAKNHPSLLSVEDRVDKRFIGFIKLAKNPRAMKRVIQEIEKFEDYKGTEFSGSKSMDALYETALTPYDGASKNERDVLHDVIQNVMPEISKTVDVDALEKFGEELLALDAQENAFERKESELEKTLATLGAATRFEKAFGTSGVERETGKVEGQQRLIHELEEKLEGNERRLKQNTEDYYNELQSNNSKSWFSRESEDAIAARYTPNHEAISKDTHFTRKAIQEAKDVLEQYKSDLAQSIERNKRAERLKTIQDVKRSSGQLVRGPNYQEPSSSLDLRRVFPLGYDVKTPRIPSFAQPNEPQVSSDDLGPIRVLDQGSASWADYPASQYYGSEGLAPVSLRDVSAEPSARNVGQVLPYNRAELVVGNSVDEADDEGLPDLVDEPNPASTSGKMGKNTAFLAFAFQGIMVAGLLGVLVRSGRMSKEKHKENLELLEKIQVSEEKYAETIADYKDKIEGVVEEKQNLLRQFESELQRTNAMLVGSKQNEERLIESLEKVNAQLSRAENTLSKKTALNTSLKAQKEKLEQTRRSLETDLLRTRSEKKVRERKLKALEQAVETHQANLSQWWDGVQVKMKQLVTEKNRENKALSHQIGELENDLVAAKQVNLSLSEQIEVTLTEKRLVEQFYQEEIARIKEKLRELDEKYIRESQERTEYEKELNRLIYELELSRSVDQSTIVALEKDLASSEKMSAENQLSSISAVEQLTRQVEMLKEEITQVRLVTSEEAKILTDKLQSQATYENFFAVLDKYDIFFWYLFYLYYKRDQRLQTTLPGDDNCFVSKSGSYLNWGFPQGKFESLNVSAKNYYELEFKELDQDERKNGENDTVKKRSLLVFLQSEKYNSQECVAYLASRKENKKFVGPFQEVQTALRERDYLKWLPLQEKVFGFERDMKSVSSKLMQVGDFYDKWKDDLPLICLLKTPANINGSWTQNPAVAMMYDQRLREIDNFGELLSKCQEYLVNISHPESFNILVGVFSVESLQVEAKKAFDVFFQPTAVPETYQNVNTMLNTRMNSIPIPLKVAFIAPLLEGPPPDEKSAVRFPLLKFCLFQDSGSYKLALKQLTGDEQKKTFLEFARAEYTAFHNQFLGLDPISSWIKCNKRPTGSETYNTDNFFSSRLKRLDESCRTFYTTAYPLRDLILDLFRERLGAIEAAAQRILKPTQLQHFKNYVITFPEKATKTLVKKIKFCLNENALEDDRFFEAYVRKMIADKESDADQAEIILQYFATKDLFFKNRDTPHIKFLLDVLKTQKAQMYESEVLSGKEKNLLAYLCNDVERTVDMLELLSMNRSWKLSFDEFVKVVQSLPLQMFQILLHDEKDSVKLVFSVKVMKKDKMEFEPQVKVFDQGYFGELQWGDPIFDVAKAFVDNSNKRTFMTRLLCIKTGENSLRVDVPKISSAEELKLASAEELEAVPPSVAKVPEPTAPLAASTELFKKPYGETNDLAAARSSVISELAKRQSRTQPEKVNVAATKEVEPKPREESLSPNSSSCDEMLEVWIKYFEQVLGTDQAKKTLVSAFFVLWFCPVQIFFILILSHVRIITPATKLDESIKYELSYWQSDYTGRTLKEEEFVSLNNFHATPEVMEFFLNEKVQKELDHRLSLDGKVRPLFLVCPSTLLVRWKIISTFFKFRKLRFLQPTVDPFTKASKRPEVETSDKYFPFFKSELFIDFSKNVICVPELDEKKSLFSPPLKSISLWSELKIKSNNFSVGDPNIYLQGLNRTSTFDVPAEDDTSTRIEINLNSLFLGKQSTSILAQFIPQTPEEAKLGPLQQPRTKPEGNVENKGTRKNVVTPKLSEEEALRAVDLSQGIVSAPASKEGLLPVSEVTTAVQENVTRPKMSFLDELQGPRKNKKNQSLRSTEQGVVQPANQEPASTVTAVQKPKTFLEELSRGKVLRKVEKGVGTGGRMTKQNKRRKNKKVTLYAKVFANDKEQHQRNVTKHTQNHAEKGGKVTRQRPYKRRSTRRERRPRMGWTRRRQ